MRCIADLLDGDGFHSFQDFFQNTLCCIVFCEFCMEPTRNIPVLFPTPSSNFQRNLGWRHSAKTAPPKSEFNFPPATRNQPPKRWSGLGRLDQATKALRDLKQWAWKLKQWVGVGNDSTLVLIPSRS